MRPEVGEVEAIDSVGTRRNARRFDAARWLTIVATIFMTTLVVVALAGTSRDTALSAGDAGSLSFGWPVDWIQQDQSQDGHEYPTVLSPVSPIDNDTSFSVPWFLLDFATVFGSGLLLYRLALGLVHFARRGRFGRTLTVLGTLIIGGLGGPALLYWDAQDTEHLRSKLFSALVTNLTLLYFSLLATRDADDTTIRRTLTWTVAIALVFAVVWSLLTEVASGITS